MINYKSIIEVANFNLEHYVFPDSWLGHTPFANWLIKEIVPATIVELGTHTGNSYFSFCQTVKDYNINCKCYAIDTWEGDKHAGFYGDKIFKEVNEYNEKNYRHFSNLMRMPFDQGVEYFRNNSIDLLHIDGCHTYEAAQHDFETWLPKLRNEAFVLFHDTNVRERGFGVWKFWEEIKEKYDRTLEFYHSSGLGVLQIGSPVVGNEYLYDIFNETDKLFINFFQILGENTSKKLKLKEQEKNIKDLNNFQKEKDNVISEMNTRIKKLEETIQINMKNLEKANQIIKEKNDTIVNLTGEIALLDYKDKKINIENNLIHSEIIKNIDNINLTIKKINDITGKNSFDLNKITLISENSLGNIILKIKHYLSKRTYNKWKEYIALNKIYKNSYIFSEKWYKNRYPDINFYKINPVRHYFLYGSHENRDITPYFSTKWYLDEYQDVKDSGINPIYHYFTHGFKEGRKPIPLFWPLWYKEKYLKIHSDDIEPLTHYISQGYKKGYKPCPYFDTNYYISKNSDLDFLIHEPLKHYMLIGWKEGRKPSPYFNPAWYNAHNEDVFVNQIDPLTHYITKGWKEERNPNEYFFVKWYINKFLKKDDTIEPLLHYICEGIELGTSPNPYFDSEWYCFEYMNKSTRKNNTSLEHYMEMGRITKNKPNPYFDSSWYSERYPDIAKSYDDPFVHFIEFGANEQRQPNKFFDYQFYCSKYKPTLLNFDNPFLHFLETERDQLTKPFYTENLPSYSLNRKGHLAEYKFNYRSTQQKIINNIFDVVIVTFNSEKWIKPCLNSLIKFNDSIRITCVDNASTDGTINLLTEFSKKFPHFTLIENERNVGFGEGNNIGTLNGDSEYIIFLNIDTEILDTDFLGKLNKIISLSSDDIAAWEFRQIPYEHPKIYDPISLETGWMSGAAFCIRRKCFNEINGFDKKLFMYCEDVDLSWRLRSKGFRLLYCPQINISHYCYQDRYEAKPLASLYGMLHNYFLRIRFGSEYDRLIGYDSYFMNFRKIDNPPIIGDEEITNLTTYFRNTAVRNSKSFTPTFYGYDYEITRDGAFYDQKLNTSDKLISFIIRTIGNLYHLENAILTVLNQTHNNIEIIIVEDGSTIAKDLISTFNTDIIKYYPIEKSGRCAAGNIGLMHSSGEYLNFLDEDDLLFADHAEVLSSELDANTAIGVVWASAFCVYSDHDNNGNCIEKEYVLSHTADLAKDALYESNHFPIQSVMFRRECYDSLGGFDPELDMLEDWDLWLRYYKQYKFKQVQKTTSLYRVPSNQQKYDARTQQLHLYYNKVKKKHSEFF